MNLNLRKQLIFPLVTMVSLAALVAVAGWYVYQKHQFVNGRLASYFEPRYARLTGLKNSGANLASAVERARELETVYIYAAEIDSNQTGNDAQQRIRSLLSAAGMSISSSQVLPSKQERGLEHIQLSVRADGDIVALHSALAGLVEQRPVVLIDALNVQAQMGGDRGAQRLSVQFNFLILRRLQP